MAHGSHALVCKEVPLPLCLRPLGDALDRLFGPFLSPSETAFASCPFLCSRVFFSVCRVNFCEECHLGFKTTARGFLVGVALDQQQ